MTDRATLEYLEKLLAGLRGRYLAGDTSVEAQLRATAAKTEELRVQLQVNPPQPQQGETSLKERIKKLMTQRRSCCR